MMEDFATPHAHNRSAAVTEIYRWTPVVLLNNKRRHGQIIPLLTYWLVHTCFGNPVSVMASARGGGGGEEAKRALETNKSDKVDICLLGGNDKEKYNLRVTPS